MPKLLRIAVVVLVPYLGAAAWLLLRFRRRRPAEPPRPAAPDDDPDYSRWLQRQEHWRKRDKG